MVKSAEPEPEVSTESEDDIDKDTHKIVMDTLTSGKDDAEEMEVTSETESNLSDDSDSQQNEEPSFEFGKAKRGRSKGRPYRTGYNVETLKVAYQAVGRGMSVYSAAKKYHVPQSTLRDRVLGRISAEVTSSGPPTIFTRDEESAIAAYVKLFSDIGYPLSRVQVRELAAELATGLERRDFSDGKILSLRWYYKLLDKYPEMQSHKFTIPKLLDMGLGYYTKLTQVYQELDFGNAKRIFSLDSVSVHTGEESLKMICRNVSEGNPDVSVLCDDAKITMLCCVSASGKKVPPCFVFRNENDAPSRKTVNKLHRGATIKISNGSVVVSGSSPECDPQILMEYFESHFSQHVKLKGKKHVVFYDSRRFKVTLQLWLWGEKNSIIFFPLLIPRSSSQVIPATLPTGCLYGVSGTFNNEEKQFSKENDGSKFTILEACRSLNRLYVSLCASHIEHAFQSMKVFPLPKNNPGNLVYDNIINDTENDRRTPGKNSKKAKKKKKKKITPSLAKSSKRKQKLLIRKEESRLVSSSQSDEETSDDNLNDSPVADLPINSKDRRRSKGAKRRRVDTSSDAADVETKQQFLPIDWTGVLAPNEAATGRSVTPCGDDDDVTDETAGGAVVKTEGPGLQNTEDNKNIAGVSLDTEETTVKVETSMAVDDCTYYVYIQQGDDNSPTQTSVNDSANMPVSVAEEVVIV